MLDWLFPNWSDPLGIALLLALRLACNLGLTATVADRVGRRRPRTVAMAAGTVASTVLSVVVLRPGVLGIRASLVEVLLQASLVVVALVTTYQRPDGWLRVLATVALAVVALLFGLVMISVYGEALVAP
jgi:hypothetical protein